jgi:alginate O-acetyltransferase complex protein AlgI
MNACLLLLIVLTSAFALSRLTPGRLTRLAAWLLVAAAGWGVERLTANEPAVLRMTAIIFALLWSFKALVSVEEQVAGKPRLPALKWWIFAVGWLGMRPTEFLSLGGEPRHGWQELLVKGARRLVLGLLLVALAVTLGAHTSSAAWDVRTGLATGLLLTGLSLTFHFGLLNLLAGWWRWCGANCRSLFRAPALATSLSEFWGQRWNLAFSEMTSIAIVRPLRSLVGTPVATLIAFLFSGLLHELAISLPVRAGYGLPMAFFMLHGMAVLIEQMLARAGLAVNRNPAIGRLWTAAWVLLPLPLLFHAAFLQGCVWQLVS